MDTPPTDKEIRAHALRDARNTWRRFLAYQRRYVVKYPSRKASLPRAEAFFDNRLLEDSFARLDDPNSLPFGKRIKARQDLSDSIMKFRATLPDPSKYDEIYAERLASRMPGHRVTISRAMSASSEIHEKDSIRTFVTRVR